MLPAKKRATNGSDPLATGREHSSEARSHPLRALLALLLLCAACAAAPQPSPRGGASSEPGAAHAARRRTVAVFPFENLAVTGRDRLAFLSDWLPDAIASTLATAGGLRVVERRELLRVLEEQRLGSDALASRETRLSLGRIAGAETLVFGNFTAVGDTLQLEARLVDAESGAVLKTSAARGPAAEARRLGEELAGSLGHDLGVGVARAAAARGLVDDRALRAAEHYYRGFALEREGKRDEAIDAYRQALEIDRSDAESRERLRKLIEASP